MAGNGRKPRTWRRRRASILIRRLYKVQMGSFKSRTRGSGSASGTRSWIHPSCLEVPMIVSRIHHVQITIPRGAEGVARRFYCEILGLQEIEKPVELRARGGLWLRISDQEVHIGTEDGVDRS